MQSAKFPANFHEPERIAIFSVAVLPASGLGWASVSISQERESEKTKVANHRPNNNKIYSLNSATLANREKSSATKTHTQTKPNARVIVRAADKKFAHTHTNSAPTRQTNAFSRELKS